MFGVGYQEMFVLLVAALIIFGPGRLPELAGQVGRWVRDFRRMTADLTGEFEKTMAEVEDVKKSVRREMRSMRDEVDGVSKSVEKDLSGGRGKPAIAAKSGAAKGIAAKKSGPGSAPSPARSATSARAGVRAGGSLAVPLATKADPLSDVSVLDEGPLVAPNGRAASGDGAAAAGSTDSATNGAARTAANGFGQPIAVGGDEALARVRRRRAAAGYNQRTS